MNHIEATQYIKQTLATFSPREVVPLYTWVKLYEAMSVSIEQSAQQEPVAQQAAGYVAVCGILEQAGIGVLSRSPSKMQIEEMCNAIRTLTTFPPAQRKPLTDEEKEAIWKKHSRTLGGWDHGGTEVIDDNAFDDVVSAIEAAHGIK